MKITDQLVSAKYAQRAGQEFTGVVHQPARKIYPNIVKRQHLSLQNCQSDIVRRRCVIAMNDQSCIDQIEHLDPVVCTDLIKHGAHIAKQVRLNLFLGNGATFEFALFSLVALFGASGVRVLRSVLRRLDSRIASQSHYFA